MRRSLFLYLFLFAALWIVFQYVNNVNVYENQEKRIQNLELQVQRGDSANAQLKDENFDANYFTVRGNENAYTYFENDGRNIEEILPAIEDGVYAQNTKEGNPLIPYEGFEAPFRINKVQVLNHKWIIADFSDGMRWGELLLRYDIDSTGTVRYETLESLIYPKTE